MGINDFKQVEILEFACENTKTAPEMEVNY
jgi:hypothetical protein